MELTPAQRRALRARAHRLQPVVMLGEAGLTAQVLREIDASLKSHELIKIRVVGEGRAARAALADAIGAAMHAAPVQQIGKVLVLYRPRPEPLDKPGKPHPPRRRPARRTKRSYQD